MAFWLQLLLRTTSQHLLSCCCVWVEIQLSVSVSILRRVWTCVCVRTCACGGLCDSRNWQLLRRRQHSLDMSHVVGLHTVCAHSHTYNILWDMKVTSTHMTSQRNLSYSWPPFLSSPFFLGIAVWSISTMTCVRAASFLGALPRATSSTTPWWSTAHRWGRSTHTLTHKLCSSSSHISFPHAHTLCSSI